MDLRKERRKERRLKRKNRNRKTIKKKVSESYSYNWCIHDDCILSLNYFNTEKELYLHIEENHSK